MPVLSTPDGRYVIVDGHLWRSSNPELPAAQRQQLVDELMAARRAVKMAKRSQNIEDLALARLAVNSIKISLGERGPVWWSDGSKDFNRCLVKNTPYASWFASIPSTPLDTV
ncbi:MAG: hypothetical protein ACOH1R_07645 [Luteimonas sp.]